MPYKQSNKWRAVVKFKGNRYTKLFPTKQKAKEWEIRIKETLSNDLTDMDYLMLCNSYLDHVKVRFSEKTYNEKVSVCIRFGQFIGKNTSVGQVEPKMIDDFLTKQAVERTAHAANKDRKNLLAMWNWGMKIYDLDRNPVIKIDRFAHDRKPQYTPPENDVLKVLAATSGPDRVFLVCYLNTAARRSEIFNLKWDDVNFEKREIRLWTRKTRDGSLEGEWLPMNETLSRGLFWWWNNRNFKESPFVFIDEQPGPHYGNPYKVRRRFLPGLCERAGVKPFGNLLKSFGVPKGI